MCVAVYARALQCVAECCGVLQCVAGCYRVLQGVAECGNVLQCVAVCCSVLQECCRSVAGVLQHTLCFEGVVDGSAFFHVCNNILTYV